MTRDTLQLTDALREYLLSVSLREPELLAQLRKETEPHPYSRMQIGPEQGQFMALLLEMIGARRVIEIGVFTGYSSLAMALALPDDGKIIACDINDEYTQTARRYWRRAGVTHKIDLRLGPALKTLDALIAAGESGRFDFAFIDADKENEEPYFDRVLKLLRPGGIIAVDNVLWGGRVIDEQDQDTDTVAIRQFNRNRRDDQRVSLSMIPIGDGLTLALKR